MVQLRRNVPTLLRDEPVGEAIRGVMDSDLPALPVLNADGTYAGIFGEREFLTAVFPGYMSELKSAAFVPHSLDDALEKRATCRAEAVGQHMNPEAVGLPGDLSDPAGAETFL